MRDDKTGGENSFEKKDKFSSALYGVGINTERVEGFGKIGYVFPKTKYQSIGLQLSAFNHEQDAFFGMNEYKGTQDNFFANLIYQSIIGNTNHKFRTGLSLNADRYNEAYMANRYQRNETVAGGYFEYTWSPLEKFNLVAGIRGDHNSLFGWFSTPRLNIRYEPVTGTTIRATAGRGQRTANILAENMGNLISSRLLSIESATHNKGFGLSPEVAWNKGISVDQKLKLFNRAAMISVDYFRNDFTNQVIVDLEDARRVRFYNLDGKSYSNSLQAEISMIPLKALDLKMAYRLFDVKATYDDKLLQRPFTARHRAFVNLGYDYNGWKFDYTVNYTGEKRIPSTAGNPEKYRLAERSPDYITMNAQISKMLHKKTGLELYVGAENLTGFMQKHAILASDEPFGPHFDASMIWGPLTERMFYGGFRMKLK
jgi:outer membrane receptor for ferrienterochelin and colicin